MCNLAKEILLFLHGVGKSRKILQPSDFLQLLCEDLGTCKILLLQLSISLLVDTNGVRL